MRSCFFFTIGVCTLLAANGSTQLHLTGGADIDMTGSTGSQIIFPDGTMLDSAANVDVPQGHGGRDNTLLGTDAYIGGGRFNQALGNYAAVGGGGGNYSSQQYSVIAGGRENTIDAHFGAIVGGIFNQTASGYAFVGGGKSNDAGGYFSVVPGGEENEALGSHSFAAGYHASAAHDGSFVWSDLSSASTFATTGNNQFLIRATGGVGIGTQSPVTRLHVSGAANGAASGPNHIMMVENTSTGTSPDVLILKMGETGAQNIGAENNFISFWAGTDSVGAIQGNNAGIVLAGPGNDFAEWLPRLYEYEDIEAGDIIGLKDGAVTKNTDQAARIMVVSTSPIVRGNDPGEALRESYEQIAFVGQALVKVRGPVMAGDYILASGLHDGTGIGVPPNEVTPDQSRRMVGQAMEGSNQDGIKRIRVMIGHVHADPALRWFENELAAKQAQIESLEVRLTATMQQLKALEARLGEPEP